MFKEEDKLSLIINIEFMDYNLRQKCEFLRIMLLEDEFLLFNNVNDPGL